MSYRQLYLDKHIKMNAQKHSLLPVSSLFLVLAIWIFINRDWSNELGNIPNQNRMKSLKRMSQIYMHISLREITWKKQALNSIINTQSELLIRDDGRKKLTCQFNEQTLQVIFPP